MSKVLRFMLLFEENGEYRNSGQIFKAKTPLKAAHKAYRGNKSLIRVYVCEEGSKTVHSFATDQFTGRPKGKKKKK